MSPLIRWFHQLGSPPYFDRFATRWAPWAYLSGLLAMGIGVYGALYQVPADYQQGDSFRILYIHVPSAWMSLFVFGLMAFYSAIALIWRIKLCEILAMACAPIGAAFTLITLITGSTTTRVPTLTRSNRSVTSSFSMPKQPDETNLPMVDGWLVPWMRYTVEPRYIARAPSGLSGPPTMWRGRSGRRRSIWAGGVQLGHSFLAVMR